MFPKYSKSSNKLTEDADGFFLLKLPTFFKLIMKGSSSTVLIHKIAIIFSLQQLVEFDNMGARFQNLVNGKLVIDALLDLVVI